MSPIIAFGFARKPSGGYVWVGLLVEGLLKFALIGEIFAHVFDPYPSVAKLGKFLIRGVGCRHWCSRPLWLPPMLRRTARTV